MEDDFSAVTWHSPCSLPGPFTIQTAKNETIFVSIIFWIYFTEIYQGKPQDHLSKQ